MKKLVAVLALSLLASAGHAQQVSHVMFKLRLSDGSPLSVNVDGQYINRNTSILRLDGLEAGQHKVEVYRNRDNNRRPKRIFTGTISLDPGMVYVGLVDLGTQRLRMKTRPYDPARDGQGAAGAPPSAGGTDRTDGFGSYPDGRDAPPNAPDFSGEPVPAGIINPGRLADLEKQVMQKKTDGERMTALKSQLVNARLSVAQLDKVLYWLSFESSRLEFVDWVRSRVADPEHLEKLEYRFSLDENRTAFRKLIDRS